MAAAHWKIELLGGLSVSYGAVRVTHFRTRKAASLLAYLILHPKRHSRETLTDAFWPDADIDAARTSFRVSLSHIRKELGDEFLDAGRETVAIAAPLVCDVAEFERAVRAKRWNDAARLYSGPLLPGFWDDWIVETRERLEALYKTVREHAADATTEPALTLPPDLNRFFGREDEIEQMGELLTENRLVTLLGPGGIGKTRLSLAAARRHAALFPGGVWFISLADVITAERILPTIRDSLDLPRNVTDDPLTQIADCLTGELPCLLILDNFEQIAALGASVVSALLSRTPNLTVLVSSRRRLGVPGERQKTVSPLAEAPSVALFCDRASVAPSDDIAALCRELEGVPLAIELCAARAGVFSVVEMRQKLVERFALLSSSEGDKTARHRSLYAAIDWSYRLLTPEQRRFFGRLSAFRGGWTREAAESVCDEPATAEYLAQLRERSLILSEESQGGIRFRMLESLREFAEERLTKYERAEQAARHSSFFLALAEESAGKLHGAESIRILHTLDTEQDNLRVALASCGEGASRSHSGLRFAAAMGEYWIIRGLAREGRDYLRPILERMDDDGVTAERSRATYYLAALCATQGDYAEAEVLYQHSLAWAQQTGENGIEAAALAGLGGIARERGHYIQARRLLEESVNLQRHEEPTRIAGALNALGLIAWNCGEIEESESLLQECLRLLRERGDVRGIAYTLNDLGLLAAHRGSHEAAHRYYQEALALWREIKDPRGIAYALEGLGAAAFHTGDFSGSRTLHEESFQLRQRAGDRRGIGLSLVWKAVLAGVCGAFAEAHAYLEQCVKIRHQQNDRAGLVVLISLFAYLAAQQGWGRRSIQLFSASERLRQEIGNVLSPTEQARQEDQITSLRIQSDSDEFDADWAKGATLTMGQAIELALTQTC